MAIVHSLQIVPSSRVAPGGVHRHAGRTGALKKAGSLLPKTLLASPNGHARQGTRGAHPEPSKIVDSGAVAARKREQHVLAVPQIRKPTYPQSLRQVKRPLDVLPRESIGPDQNIDLLLHITDMMERAAVSRIPFPAGTRFPGSRAEHLPRKPGV